MFLRFIKEIALKKNIKKSLYKYQSAVKTGKINSIGILTSCLYKDSLLKALAAEGLNTVNITVLCFREKGKEVAKGTFSYADITAAGQINNTEANAFIGKAFDLLISYYDGKIYPLMLASVQSEAVFKVGLSGTGHRINDVVIDTGVNNYNVFAAELIKYLTAFKKI